MKDLGLFTEECLEAIRRATVEAEKRTSGEIVPYIVERVDDHDEARWRASTLGALLAALLAGGVHALGGFWGGAGVWWITLPALAGGGLGYFLAGFEGIGRRLIPSDHLDRRVQLRAGAAFLEEEVFKTRDRTGILIFLALFERRAVVLADEGIHRAVPQDQWQQVIDDLVAGIKARKAPEALQKAIGRCGELLALHKVDRRPDDEDELDNAPRVKRR
ncbi:MAG: TPM domain-containing protein [Thermoanaerobaculales bacterium]